MIPLEAQRFARNAPLLEDVVELVDRTPLLETFGESPLAPTDSSAELLCERLVLPELAEDGLVEEVLDVLCVVERGGSGRALVGSLGRLGNTRKDALEDAESSEVGERALKPVGAEEVGSGQHWLRIGSSNPGITYFLRAWFRVM